MPDRHAGDRAWVEAVDHYVSRAPKRGRRAGSINSSSDSTPRHAKRVRKAPSSKTTSGDDLLERRPQGRRRVSLKRGSGQSCFRGRSRPALRGSSGKACLSGS